MAETKAERWRAAGAERRDSDTPQRRRAWAIAYRLTGSTADADDIVQEAMVRWLERDPDGGSPPDAWLVRVATHLGIDALRARKRRGYAGVWLPSLTVDTDEGVASRGTIADFDPAARYGRAESLTLAFLVALEALTARQRAVLILRDVMSYSAAATADVLRITEGNVRVVHLRARRVLEGYDRTRCLPNEELWQRHGAALRKLLTALQQQDVRALETLLMADVATLTDGGGEFTALKAPLVGREAVLRFYLRATRNRADGAPSVELRWANALPVALIRLANPIRRQAPVTAMALRVVDDGRIGTIYTVLASAKLRAFRSA